MEIKYHHKDAMVLARELGAPVVHGCNAQGVMGSGFAAMIASKYPEAQEAYLDKFAGEGLVLGELTTAISNGVLIINLITQDQTSREERMTDYEAVARGFKQINEILREAEVTDLVMPAIGADLGGGSWRIISTIISVELRDVQPHVCYLDEARWEVIKAS